MSNLRISASEMFAIESTRAVLAKHRLPKLGRASGPWLNMEVNSMPIIGSSDGPKSRKVYILLSVRGIDVRLESVCQITNVQGDWSEGYVLLMPAGYYSEEERFMCEYEVRLDGRTIITKRGDLPS